MGVCVPLALSLSFENSELNCSTAKRIWNPELHSKFFEILKFMLLKIEPDLRLSEVGHMSFCMKFSGLIILEKSY